MVGGLAVHYHTRDAKNPQFPATATLDVDFGICLGTDVGMAGTVQFDLSMLGYESMENGRMFREMEHGTLFIDFLTEHPPRQSGTREVSGIIASVCPGINRALEVRKFVGIQCIDKSGDSKIYQVLICGMGPLLAKLKTEKLVLAWRSKRTTRAAVRVEIEKMLDSGLPEKYTTELFEQKCGVLFQHVLEKYPESGESVYEAAG